MTLSILAVLCGLVLLLWSAERFVVSASTLAARLGMPPLLIGMIVVGFGTSAPEMTVSVLASLGGNPGIALGNAYGSNITNFALILGITAVIAPVAVQSQAVKRELPLLLGLTVVAGYQLLDGEVSRLDAVVLLVLFAGLLLWSLLEAHRRPADPLGDDVAAELRQRPDAPIGRSVVGLVVGLAVLIISSRLLVWGAVDIARTFGVSDLVIGLTVIAIGTSLPELASSVVAARRGEHDLAFGNLVGSNLFNTLVVIGLAGLARPLPVSETLLQRDVPVMTGLTVLVLLYGFNLRGRRRINRIEGLSLIVIFVAYTSWLLIGSTPPASS
ncbi:calcium/sodium antiporter [Wenzhouxiangella sp. XN79A]|uniref:calcium/sodium antiporter n=1 Tax=Wenzhouxiangella sp. XN79A TaxID=2724193 RepID=UPI00144AA6CE|nr:calcium/sodium antiporter [Wenzhouxiangella sp. XN79A]NKI34800.1 calcium/sodium antiporter [Wenzhouxiangella sp. XN79A]